MTYQTTAPAHRSVKASSPSSGWLTAVLRPAGTLDGASAAAFGRSLTDLSTTADMVVVDLDAARIPDLAAFVDALRPAAARLARPRKCLLFVNAPSALAGAVQSAGVPAATLAADAFPTPHPHWNGPGVDHASQRCGGWFGLTRLRTWHHSIRPPPSQPLAVTDNGRPPALRFDPNRSHPGWRLSWVGRTGRR